MLKKTPLLTLLRVTFLALPLVITHPGSALAGIQSTPAPASPSVQVGFSPEGSATRLVLDTINSAQHSIRMMAYSFTDPDVMKALGQAKKRGVDVRIVVGYVTAIRKILDE